MITFLNILLVAALLVLVLMAAFSASLTDPPPADVDTPDALSAKDKDLTDNSKTDAAALFQTGSPLADALPGQYQSSRSRAALTMQAASAPK